MPAGPFHLIFCRNLVFTYFTPELQKKILIQIYQSLEPGGFIIIGSHESLPFLDINLEPFANNTCIYKIQQ